MGFFTSKSETLLQSFVDTFVKGIISSLLIAGLAIFVTHEVNRSIEISAKKAALRSFNNDYLVKSADFLMTSYADLSCARDTLRVANPDCKTGLGKFITDIDERKNFLAALFPGGDFAALDKTATALVELKNVRDGSDADPQAIKRSIGQLSEQLPIAVNQITQNIQ